MVRSAHPRRQGLRKFFSTFPDGWPGVGLLLLRVAVASNAIGQGLCALLRPNGTAPAAWALGLLAILAGLVFLAGILTPIAGFVLTFGFLSQGVALFLPADASKHGCAFAALNLAAMSLALALLGPGAFSVDARLFGRLEIVIPDGRRPPR